MTTTIANRFTFSESDRIGAGGMGIVYKATDTRTGQPVAVKMLKEELLTSNPEMIERFRREVDALRRIDHPNVIKLIGTTRHEDKYYIIMEYVPGGSLRDLLDRRGVLPVEEALQIALDLCDALTRAHRLQIIHRDLKPDNVLLGENDVPKLTDFGVARVGDRTRLTQSGMTVGTGAYLSPESCKGWELDQRDDIWAFGVMLYELLTGKRPFMGDSLAAIITAILMQPMPDIQQLRPELPSALVNLIGRMLEKDRDLRINSIRQVGALIEAILTDSEASLAGTLQSVSADDSLLLPALLTLAGDWEAQAQAANAQAASARLGDQGKAAYQRGMAKGLEAAAGALRGLMRQDVSSSGAAGESAVQRFTPMEKMQVRKMLELGGWRFSQLYAHNDHTFSIVFARGLMQSFDDRVAKLTALHPALVVLEYGTLPESNDAYIEFAFRGEA